MRPDARRDSAARNALPASGPLRWDVRLENAAQGHSTDMASNNFFSHTGSDGGSLSRRVTESGFQWRRVGENIAGGQNSVADAVQAWIDSPGHCRNLMDPSFSHTALACVRNGDSDLRQYWTQVLARKR